MFPYSVWFDSGYIFVSLQRPGLSCRGAEVDSHGLAVQHTMVSPQLQFIIKVVIFHFVAQRQAISHGLTVPAGHRDSFIAAYGGRCPVVQVEQVHIRVVAQRLIPMV